MSEQIKENVEAFMQREGLALAFTFVPFSQSRNNAEKSPSLNYVVTLTKGGREVVKTDYSMGCAHCPAYKLPLSSYEKNQCIAFECEKGKRAAWLHNMQVAAFAAGTLKGAILPQAVDVLYSLALDAEVMNAGGFEAWASDLGYDTDSRSAEKIYHACLEIALKLNAALGSDKLAELQELVREL